MVLIDKIFKEGCEFIGWNFIEGEDHWNNVKDIENIQYNEHGTDDTEKNFYEKKKYFFLLSKRLRRKKNEYGATTERIWSGEIVLVVRSNLTDPTYQFKLDNHINPLYDESEKMDDYIPNCEGWTINKWDVVSEVADVYDTNFDGIKIEFEISQNV